MNGERVGGLDIVMVRFCAGIIAIQVECGGSDACRPIDCMG